MKIKKADAVGLVVDIQERLFPHIFEHEQLQENAVKLIRGLRILDVPLLVTQQYTKGLGPTIPAIDQALEHYTPVEKLTFSCCGAPGLMESLEQLGRKQVILFGIETHVCVLQTTLDLLEQGYQPVLIEDCVSSRKLNDKLVAVERMRSEGAIISTYESILFELSGIAGTDTFKAISKLVK